MLNERRSISQEKYTSRTHGSLMKGNSWGERYTLKKNSNCTGEDWSVAQNETARSEETAKKIRKQDLVTKRKGE
jgi:hypothetical protein